MVVPRFWLTGLLLSAIVATSCDDGAPPDQTSRQTASTEGFVGTRGLQASLTQREGDAIDWRWANLTLDVRDDDADGYLAVIDYGDGKRETVGNDVAWDCGLPLTKARGPRILRPVQDRRNVEHYYARAGVYTVTVSADSDTNVCTLDASKERVTATAIVDVRAR